MYLILLAVGLLLSERYGLFIQKLFPAIILEGNFQFIADSGVFRDRRHGSSNSLSSVLRKTHDSEFAWARF